MLISDLIEQTVGQMDNTLEVKSFGAVVNDVQQVTFCCNKWLKLYGSLEVDGVGVSVNSYGGDGSVFLDINDPAQEINFNSVVTIQIPLFLDGNLTTVQWEWSKLSLDERAKLPFIWQVAPTPETINNTDTGIGKTSDLTMWFVHWSDWSKMNAERQSEAIRPLMALVSEFVKTIDRLTHIFEGYDSYSQKDFPKMGTETPQGIEKTFFGTTLSAIELKMSVRIFARYCEKC